VTDPRPRQILLNLIDNAVKFSPAESAVEITLDRPINGVVRLSIADCGPGIGADDLKRIFEPFWQAGDTYSRAYGGVGLGLAIAQRLAAALGGSIAVESRRGEGSTFTIILPLSSVVTVPVVKVTAT
jgi:signal transduction histidine kinase